MNTIKKIIPLALVALVMVGCYYQNPDGSYDTGRVERTQNTDTPPSRSQHTGW